MKKNEDMLAYLGECYTQLELAKKGLKAFKIKGLGFDFLLENGLKIEVKSALPSFHQYWKKGHFYRYKIWQFRLSSKKQLASDFFILVAFEDLGEEPLGYFILPREIVNKKTGHMVMFESDINGEFKKVNKMDKHQYFNNWDLIINFKSKFPKNSS